jgi:hypothetical protein
MPREKVEKKQAAECRWGDTEPPESTSSAEGMHQAILDIISAMKDLKNKIL